MPRALKASISVTAGLIPNELQEELTRIWHFTNEHIGAMPDSPHRHAYSDGIGAAMRYAATLQNPGVTNWVKVEWIWL